MLGERWDRLEELFDTALELPPIERRALLDGACTADPELRRAIESLLEADAEAAGFLARSATESDSDQTIDLAVDVERDLRSLGTYRILHRLDQGGMSAVYLAESSAETMRRLVAIKILRDSANGRDARRRLRLEGRILAGLDHPHIAKLHDAGTTPGRRPYFVMEWVEGLPIDVYCERDELSIVQRIALFRKVCAAVHYAHQNLIVHRDLKPANILVTTAGEPKLLDFGIAKLLGPTTDHTLAKPTVAWMRVLTPGYASPEQVHGQPITTASDVYGLGVLLHHLLSGAMPHRLENLSLEAIAHTLDETAPQLPSEALADLSQPARVRMARGCRSQPDALQRLLRGDLDAIVRKALRRAPPRRYETAAALASDLTRWATGRPVKARRANAGYWLGKLIRRNRWPVAAITLIIVGILGFGVGILAQNRSLRQARAQLEQLNQRNERVLSLMADAFRTATADDETQSRNLSVFDALERIRPSLHRRFQNDPEAHIAVLRTIGTIYHGLGLYTDARSVLATARVKTTDHFGRRHHKTARVITALGAATREAGSFAEARALGREALGIVSALTPKDAEQRIEPLNGLATTHCALGDYEAAKPFSIRALVLARRYPTPTNLLVDILANQALIFDRLGERHRAAQLYEESLDVLNQMVGPGDPRESRLTSNLGATRLRLDELAEARRLFIRAIALQGQELGAHHPELVPTLHNLSHVLEELGDLPGALENATRARDIYRTTHPKSSRTLMLEVRSAALQHASGNTQRAWRTLQEILLENQTLHGSHRYYGRGQLLLGQVLIALDREPEAMRMLEDAHQTLSAADDTDAQQALDLLATLVVRP